MISAQPIDMISEPNVFKPLGSWHIVEGNSKRLWLQLVTDDSLGKRRYLTSNVSSLQLIFERRPDLHTNTVHRTGGLKQTPRTVEKTATKSDDMYYVDLTVGDVNAILSGTVKFSLTENGQTKSWVQNWIITKELTEPGY